MPTNRHPIRHPRRGRLSHEQEMVLLYGPDTRWHAAFRTEAEHREMWARHRDRILRSYRHARRPMSWWTFESPIKYPGYDREQAALFEAGLLSEAESAELLIWWREQFERAQQPDFWFCLGPGRFLKGAAAQRAHYRWAGISRSLLSQWTAERRRRNKAIRKLKAAAEAPAA